jgi:Fe2+ or Zn2+ uptake regulation protein
MTRPRRAVVRALASRAGHVHAEEILTEVARIDPSVHRASVYRTLEALCAVGVLQHVHLGHGATAYHLRLDGRDHLHVQCHRCTTVIDLPVELLDEVASWLSRHHGFTLDAGHVALSGTCTRCATAGDEDR